MSIPDVLARLDPAVALPLAVLLFLAAWLFWHAVTQTDSTR